MNGDAFLNRSKDAVKRNADPLYMNTARNSTREEPLIKRRAVLPVVGLATAPVSVKNEPFGKPPPGYIPGRGRGATGFSGGVSRDDTTDDKDKIDYSDFNYDEFHGYSESLFKDTEYDEDDKEADEIYEDIDAKMDVRRKSRRENKLKEEILKMRAEKPTIQEQFSDLKKNLANVTAEEWESIPSVFQSSGRRKQKKTNPSYVPTPDSVLISRFTQSNSHLTSGASFASGLKTPLGLQTPIGIQTPLGMQTPIGLGFQTPLRMGGLQTPYSHYGASLGLDTPLYNSRMNKKNPIYGGTNTPFVLSGYNTPLTAAGTASMNAATPITTGDAGYGTPLLRGTNKLSLNDLGEARGTVLSVKLDELMDNVEGQTVIDPKGYLTNLNAQSTFANDTDVADVNKVRSLLKSVINTNPKHSPGWIAAARLEELAQRKNKAKEIINRACKECSNNEDVWLEAVRLEEKTSEAKIILAKAIKHIPNSIKLWIEAYKKEKKIDDKRKVLRKAIECIPNSLKLWKEAISLENENNAYILLKRAVECIPNSVEMWIALARLCTYTEAQKVLNEARRKIPTSAEIWINASMLEEKQGNVSMVDTIIKRCISNLASKNVIFEREKWIKFAQEAEHSKFPLTCESIIKHTMHIGVEAVGKKRIYKQDAENCIMNKSYHAARTLYNEALKLYKHKKSLWLDLANLELKYGDPKSVDAVLERAVKSCPQSSDLWLMLAKQKWLNNQIDEARNILAEAFVHNQNTEVISLAAVKLERENDEFDRARSLLKKSRTQCNTPKIWMQSVQLERLLRNYEDAKALVYEGLKIHKYFDKLYMIAGQIEIEIEKKKNEENKNSNKNATLTPDAYINAQKIYEEGVKRCPNSINLWLCAIDLQIEKKNFTCARALAEKAKIKIKYMHTLKTNSHVLKSKEIIETNDMSLEDELSKNIEDTKTETSSGKPISTKQKELESNINKGASVKVIENYDLLWLKLIEIEMLCNNKNINSIISEALKECPSSGILWSKAIELENKNLQNSKSVTAFNNCGNNAYVILTVAKLFWVNMKIQKARKWFYRVITLSPTFGDGWGTFLAFEIDQQNEVNQKDIINRCIKMEPNRGYMWNKIVKRVENWRLKFPQKLYKYIEELFPHVLNKPISDSVWLAISVDKENNKKTISKTPETDNAQYEKDDCKKKTKTNETDKEEEESEEEAEEEEEEESEESEEDEEGEANDEDEKDRADEEGEENINKNQSKEVEAGADRPNKKGKEDLSYKENLKMTDKKKRIK